MASNTDTFKGKFLAKIRGYSYVARNHKVIKIHLKKYNLALNKLDKKCKLLDNYDKLEKLALNAGEICYPKNYLNSPFR